MTPHFYLFNSVYYIYRAVSNLSENCDVYWTRFSLYSGNFAYFKCLTTNISLWMALFSHFRKITSSLRLFFSKVHHCPVSFPKQSIFLRTNGLILIQLLFYFRRHYPGQFELEIAASFLFFNVYLYVFSKTL